MNDLKQGLINAGFENYDRIPWDFELSINDGKGVIYISSEKKIVRIYPCKAMVFQDTKFKNLEEINKICYGTLLRDLNFEKQAK